MQKQINTNFKRKLVAVGISAIATALLMPVASSYAYGPSRPTYTMKKPADHATFNSITDNNVIGDERDFVRVAEKGGKQWVNQLKVVPGKTYQVYIFYHNNAATNTNENGGKGIAMKTRIRSSFPAKVNSSAKGKVSATISSTTTSPAKVWDEAYFTTDSKKDIQMRVVGRIMIYNQGKLNGTGLGEQIFTADGVYIGYNKLNGVIPGCSEYSGHIIYELRAEQASSTISKSVSLDGKNFFSNVTAKPGDTLTYKITFKNNGTRDLNAVTFRDTLPDGVTLVSGSVKLYDNGTKKTRSLSDALVKNGVNTGLFGEGVTGTITYKAKVDNDIVKNGNCGANNFKNTIRVTTTETGTATSTATIRVDKTCETKKDPCLNEDGSVKTECCDQDKYKNLPQCKEEPKDPCLDDDGKVKTECCDQDKYKNLPQCTEEPDPCLNEDGSVKTECCDQEKYKDLPQCKEEPDPCLNEDGSVKTECCDQEKYKDLPQCKKTPEPVAYLPNTGPGEIALAVVAAFCVVTGVTYWYRSQKEVSAVQKEVKHGSDDKK